ncbi:MAG: undecaprenyldiphospho-muramoylpentapeptide beta-N-acetylglucosaminyltransferase [Candidatus Omnitrophota bacterium]
MKIVISAGGTYGHINPALSLTAVLKKNNLAQIFFVSPNKELEGKLLRQNIKAYFIVNPKIRMNSALAFIHSLVSLITAVCACFYILLKLKPHVVVGFGGYAAFPLVFSACILGIPAAIHEQNVVIGKANRFLSYFVRKVLVSFPETKELLKSKKLVVTGNPIRQDLRIIAKYEALKYLGLSDGVFTVLVMGGSLGAHKINEKFTEAIARIKDMAFQVIHISGKDDFEFIRNFYNKIGLKNCVYTFCEEISYFFSAADLIIARAGGSTIAEISYFKIPAILIPYPYAGAHQAENAKTLTISGKAVMIDDENLNTEILSGYLKDFILHQEKLAEMKKRLSEKNNFDCAEKVAKEVLSLR